MISRKTVLAVFLLAAACGPQVPDSNPRVAGGVGFEGYDVYAAERARRNAELQAMRGRPVPEEQAIASETMGVLGATRPIGGTAIASPLPQNPEPFGGTAPVQTATLGVNPVPVAGTAPVTTNNPEISDEHSFSAVSSRESIESDAERLARQREAFEVIQPEALPERPGSGAPNIVAFALSTTHRVGQQIYRRSGNVSDTTFKRACAKYGSPDQAQEAFLADGGPERDRRNLDPDGDGFACFWDPTPFRSARGG